jgi:hypothetical protein
MPLSVFFRIAKHFLPLLGILTLSCAGEIDRLGVLDPLLDNNSSALKVDFSPDSDVRLDIRLQVKEGESPAMLSPQTLLADAMDSSSSDSMNLYLDVQITNAGGDMVFTPSQTEDIILQARVDFVDIPYKKNFSYGTLKLVIGWTDGGMQASDIQEWQFDTDSSLIFSMPLTRADSFHVADNVAVYGLELAEDRFIHATRIQRLDNSVPDDSPAIVGFVQSMDKDANRINVSGAIVVLSDSTLILDADSLLIPLDELHDGRNQLSITGLAWGYSDFVGMTANGWEFRSFNVNVANPLN